MISFSNIVLFTAVFGTSAATPGPEIIAVFARSLEKNHGAVFRISLGIIVGKLILLAAAMAGLAAAVATFHTFFQIIGFAGAGYLIYLSVKKWRNAGKSVLTPTVEQHPPVTAVTTHIMKDVSAGLALTLSNPVAIAFYLAILPGVLDLHNVGIIDFCIASGVIILVMSTIVLVYSVAGLKISGIFSGQGKLLIDRITATIFMLCAILLIVRSWT